MFNSPYSNQYLSFSRDILHKVVHSVGMMLANLRDLKKKADEHVNDSSKKTGKPQPIGETIGTYEAKLNLVIKEYSKPK